MPERGGGRRSGPLNGGTPQAEELARWLRELTGELTVRQLAERFPFGRNQWSEFRKGSKLIPQYLIGDLVRALVRGTQAQQLKIVQGEELLHEAECAALDRTVRSADRPAGTTVELQLRLDDARQGELAAQSALLGTTRLVYLLLDMVGSLTRRCQNLEKERDQARFAAAGADLSAVQHALTQTEERLAAASDSLQHARQEREEAEQLRLLAQQRAAEYRQALHELQCARAEESVLPTTPAPSGGDEPPTAGASLTPLWEYDLTLEAADEQLAAHKAGMDAARQQMGLVPDQPPGPPPPVIQGEVVRADTADTEEPPPTRPKTGPRAAPVSPGAPFRSGQTSAGGMGGKVTGHQSAPGEAQPGPPPLGCIWELADILRGLALDLAETLWHTAIDIASICSVCVVLATVSSTATYARWTEPRPAMWILAGLFIGALIIAKLALGFLPKTDQARWLPHPRFSRALRALGRLPASLVVGVGLSRPQWLGGIGDWGASIAHYLLS
ncbi:hypothetical protein [Streptomyces melanogenes]|uniref:hypothetical protein n=1 Tax=Streptomyces melanogenes TaxID=67326 RepID=UPI00167E4F87|nr:hypothetical protein [Streptomyces melanogenes]GGP82289.1 hypothetical protein GCM10010278_71130 [Streptomyces melanogenes]